MAPKKRPGKQLPGLTKGVDMTPPLKKGRSPFHLRTRTMRGKHNRSLVFERAQRMKNEILAAEAKLREQLKPVEKKKKVIDIPFFGGAPGNKDPLEEYGSVKE